MQEGASVALVTDAGMPGISDPGYRLISLAIRHHVPVVPMPGASAFLAALVASGLPTDSFRFSGFLPAKRGERRAALEAVKNSPRTQVFYEAPHRIVETLADVVEVLGEARHVVIAREVTKLHEEFLRGRAGEVLENLKARASGEGRDHAADRQSRRDDARGAADASPPGVPIRQRVEQIMAEEKLDEKAALKKVAKERGVSKSEAYRELQRGQVERLVEPGARPDSRGRPSHKLRCYFPASSFFTISLTILPSTRMPAALKLAMAFFITVPISFMVGAPISAMAAFTPATISASPAALGR